MKCEICHEKLKTKWLLKHHMVTHKEKSRTICSTCSKGFKNKISSITYSEIRM